MTSPRASKLAGLAFWSSGLSTPAVFRRSQRCFGFLPTGRVGHGAALTAAAATGSCGLKASRGCILFLGGAIGHHEAWCSSLLSSTGPQARGAACGQLGVGVSALRLQHTVVLQPMAAMPLFRAYRQCVTRERQGSTAGGCSPGLGPLYNSAAAFYAPQNNSTSLSALPRRCCRLNRRGGALGAPKAPLLLRQPST